jgi:hypothetical protein
MVVISEADEMEEGNKRGRKWFVFNTQVVFGKEAI